MISSRGIFYFFEFLHFFYIKKMEIEMDTIHIFNDSNKNRDVLLRPLCLGFPGGL